MLNDSLAARSPQKRQTFGGYLPPSLASSSATRFSSSSTRPGAARMRFPSSQRSKSFMTSSSKLTTDLHHLGLSRQTTSIAAVNVSCGAGSVGLLVQDAKGYAAVQLNAEEAAHIAGLLRDSVARLQPSDSR